MKFYYNKADASPWGGLYLILGVLFQINRFDLSPIADPRAIFLKLNSFYHLMNEISKQS